MVLALHFPAKKTPGECFKLPIVLRPYRMYLVSEKTTLLIMDPLQIRRQLSLHLHLSKSSIGKPPKPHRSVKAHKLPCTVHYRGPIPNATQACEAAFQTLDNERKTQVNHEIGNELGLSLADESNKLLFGVFRGRQLVGKEVTFTNVDYKAVVVKSVTNSKNPDILNDVTYEIEALISSMFYYNHDDRPNEWLDSFPMALKWLSVANILSKPLNEEQINGLQS